MQMHPITSRIIIAKKAFILSFKSEKAIITKVKITGDGNKHTMTEIQLATSFLSIRLQFNNNS